MLIDVGLALIGLLILILGGDFLVRGASEIARRLHISPLVIGLTIVAFGTSAPELLISVKSALAGSPDLTMGNVIGSNICNLSLVLGVSALISPIYVKSNSIKIDWPMTMGSSLLLYFLIKEGYVNAYEGIMFVVILIIYTLFVIRKSIKENKPLEKIGNEPGIKKEHKERLWRNILFIMLGCAGLYYGAEWFVNGAKKMASFLMVSERVIGISVLAIGTSLPELVTACVASIRKQTDIALGNLMGSNIFNILSILGITSIIKEIKVNDAIFHIDMLWMLGITFLLLPVMLYRKRMSKISGVMFLLIYILYMTLVVF